MDAEYWTGIVLCFALGILAAELHSRLFMKRRFDAFMNGRKAQATLQNEVLLHLSRSEREREAREARALIERASRIRAKAKARRQKKGANKSEQSDY